MLNAIAVSRLRPVPCNLALTAVGALYISVHQEMSNMQRTVTTTIDPALCNGCGLCIAVCPKETLSIQDHRAVVSGSESMNCGHCAAVCPTGAIRVAGIDPRLSTYQCFVSSEKWLPFGQFDTGELVRLMRSVRSCRNYHKTPVPRSMLEDLVKIGITAPSGSNCQRWTFTLLPDRAAVMSLAGRVAEFFEKTQRLAGKTWLRKLLSLLGKPQLENYHRDHFATVARALSLWRQSGRDALFHGAPAAILVGSKSGASCPAEDALLAASHIRLGAHCLGLGSCLIGFVVEAMKRDRGIYQFLGLPPDEIIYAVIALGLPKERYQRTGGRRQVHMRYFNP
jgi:ferredoxin